MTSNTEWVTDWNSGYDSNFMLSTKKPIYPIMLVRKDTHVCDWFEKHIQFVCVIVMMHNIFNDSRRMIENVHKNVNRRRKPMTVNVKRLIQVIGYACLQ